MMNAKIRAYRNNPLCSPHSFDFVKSRGADAVFDYKNPSARRKAEILLIECYITLGSNWYPLLCLDMCRCSHPYRKRYVLKCATSMPEETFLRDNTENAFVMGHTGF
jgi:hypothetical protein